MQRCIPLPHARSCQDEHVVIQEGKPGLGIKIKSLHDYGDTKIKTKSMESGDATFQAPEHLAEAEGVEDAKGENEHEKSSRKRRSSKTNTTTSQKTI